MASQSGMSVSDWMRDQIAVAVSIHYEANLDEMDLKRHKPST